MAAKLKLEWVKGNGVDRYGHSLTWWKNKAAKWRGSDRPDVYIQVRKYDREGNLARGLDRFQPEELKQAKVLAHDWTESTGGSAYVEGRVEIPYQPEKNATIEIGNWKFAGSDGFYVWTVDSRSFQPMSYRGPFQNPDEAVALAKQSVRGSGSYDQVITFGSDPTAGDFYIWKAFKAWSGDVHYSSDLPKVGARLREYR